MNKRVTIKNRHNYRRRKSGRISIKFITIALIILVVAIVTGYFVSKKINFKDVPDTLMVKERLVKNDDSGYLRYEEDKNAEDAIEVQNIINTNDYYRDDEKKIAYLTFDDGPSKYVTENILDILKANDVKATFFVTGSALEKNSKAPELIKRMVKEGHAIGNHTYSHDYKKLYPNGKADIEAFMADIKHNEDILKGIIGQDFRCRAIRLPGGSMSWKTKELIEHLNENNLASIDWNALNGDAEGKKKNPQQLLETLKQTVADKDNVVILMHDTDAKEDTFNYLQSAIDYLKEQGFEFRTIK